MLNIKSTKSIDLLLRISAAGHRAQDFCFSADACFDGVGEVGTKIGDSSREIAPPPPPNCEQWVEGYAAKV